MNEKVTITGLVHEAVATSPQPLDLAAIATYLQSHHPRPPKDPAQSARAAISQSHLLVSLPDGRFAYLPHALAGGAFRFVLLPPTFEHHRIFLDELAQVIFWPAIYAAGTRQDDRPLEVLLADGPQVTLTPEQILFGGLSAAAPEEFWRWLERYYPQPDDDLVVRVSAGRPLQYTLEFAPLEGRDVERLRNRNRLLADLVCAIIHRRGYPIDIHELIPLLITQGGFLDLEPPDALPRLLDLDDRIVQLGWNQYFLADLMTPSLGRQQKGFQDTVALLADRIDNDPEIAAGLLSRMASGDPVEAISAMQDYGLLDVLGLSPDEVDDDIADAPFSPFEDLDPSDPPFVLEKKGDRAQWKKDLYTLKVRLKWARRVWRYIEIRGDQTLHALHYAILDAYGWEEEHLYSFFLSNRSWDEETEIASPFAQQGWDADKVRMGALDLQVKDRFLFLFDYGDNHEFEVTLTAIGKAEKGAKYPRAVKEVGNAPPQYPEWEHDET